MVMPSQGTGATAVDPIVAVAEALEHEPGCSWSRWRANFAFQSRHSEQLFVG